MQTSRKPYPIERILSAATYMTAGGVGFVWLIVTALCKKRVTQFALYHIMQSIFISILFYLISVLAGLLYVIFYRIPLLNAIPYYINMPIILGYSILQLFTTTVILYLAITSFMGYYSYLPWVSDIIRANVRPR